LAGGVEGGAEFGFFLVGEVAHFGGESVERGFFAEEFDASVFERGLGGGGGDCGEGVGLDLGGLLGHDVEELWESEGLVNDGEGFAERRVVSFEW